MELSYALALHIAWVCKSASYRRLRVSTQQLQTSRLAAAIIVPYTKGSSTKSSFQLSPPTARL